MPRKYTTVLMWFRRDLRLLDNPALYSACLDADEVIPVYIYCPQEEAPWEPGDSIDRRRYAGGMANRVYAQQDTNECRVVLNQTLSH